MQLVCVQVWVFTHAEHDSLEGVLRFALQPFGRLRGCRWTQVVKLRYFAVENVSMDRAAE